MAMDSVSLPVVSATAPPPPRAGASANAGAPPTVAPARGPRSDVGKPSGAHAADESRRFDDVLSDVHAAKEDRTSPRTTKAAKGDDDTDTPADASNDPGQTQSAVVIVTAVPVPAIVPSQKAAADTTRHIGDDADGGNHDRPAGDPAIPAAAPGQSSLQSGAVMSLAVPQPQAPPAQDAAQDGAVSAAASEKPSSERRTAPLAAASSSKDDAPATSAKSTASDRATAPQFELLTDRPRESKGGQATDSSAATETSGGTSSSLVKTVPRIDGASERTTQEGSGVQSRLVNEQRPLEATADSPVRSAPADGAPAVAASPVQPTSTDAAARPATTAARRATSRAAAQAVIATIVQQDGQATDTGAPASTQQARGEALRVAPQSLTSSSGSVGVESGQRSAKLELQRPQITDTVAIAAATPAGHADTAAGEHRSAGQGMTGQDAAPHAKVLASAMSANVVVAPADVRQAFERMVREVTSAGPTLDASSGAAVTDQIVRSMQLQVKGNVGEARITLAPEHLGEVVVEMRVEKDGVVATLRADTPAVRGWLATHQDDLRAGLADVGLRLDDLQVSERDSQRGRQQAPADQQPQTPRRARRTSAGDLPRFEVEA